MVFDNLDIPLDLLDIDNFIQDSHHGCILVVSHYAGTKRLRQATGLDQMVEMEALWLILGPSGLRIDNTAAKEVLIWLGCLLLAIDHAGAYILRQGLHPKDFLDKFERQKDSIMKEIVTIGHEDDNKELYGALEWPMTKPHFTNVAHLANMCCKAFTRGPLNALAMSLEPEEDEDGHLMYPTPEPSDKCLGHLDPVIYPGPDWFSEQQHATPAWLGD
jgi:hypothetical protein